MNSNFKISELIKKSIVEELSSEEKLQLEKWINESDENKQLYHKLTSVEFQLQKLDEYNTYNKEKVFKKIEGEIFKESTFRLNTKWMNYAAAILLPLLIAGGISLFYSNQKDITLANIDETITPGTQKATLILSDGNRVVLDKNYEEGTILEDGMAITNRDSILNYQKSATLRKRKQLVYNELKTPRGGGYKLKLADGTNVWLNSGSTLKYPVDFTDSTRQVYLSGEAYFDVSHNGKPFIVNANNLDVRVLGTQFNVSAYDDENETITTLVEGKVAVSYGMDVKNNQILTPGLQASLNKQEESMEVARVNTSQYTSWVEGKLEFNNDDLEYVIRRLARWYDFEYTFENEQVKSYRFSARVNSEESISEILTMLEMTTNVEFKIEDNTIVIN